MRLLFLIFLFLCFFTELYAGEWIIAENSGCKVWNPHPIPNESVTYTGDCSRGVSHGKGILTWYKDSIKIYSYDGQFKEGEQHGKASLTFFNDGQKSKYLKGQFKDDELYGNGSLTLYRDGQKSYYYKGQFKDGELYGNGSYTLYINGGKRFFFKGQFKNDKPYGQGVLIKYKEGKKISSHEGKVADLKVLISQDPAMKELKIQYHASEIIGLILKRDYDAIPDHLYEYHRGVYLISKDRPQKLAEKEVTNYHNKFIQLLKEKEIHYISILLTAALPKVKWKIIEIKQRGQVNYSLHTYFQDEEIWRSMYKTNIEKNTITAYVELSYNQVSQSAIFDNKVINNMIIGLNFDTKSGLLMGVDTFPESIVEFNDNEFRIVQVAHEQGMYDDNYLVVHFVGGIPPYEIWLKKNNKYYSKSKLDSIVKRGNNCIRSTIRFPISNENSTNSIIIQDGIGKKYIMTIPSAMLTNSYSVGVVEPYATANIVPFEKSIDNSASKVYTLESSKHYNR